MSIVRDRPTCPAHYVVDGGYVEEALVDNMGSVPFFGQKLSYLRVAGFGADVSNIDLQDGHSLGDQTIELVLRYGTAVAIFHRDENPISGQDPTIRT